MQDSAARTQLSGFDSPPTSLAFSADGVLAGGGWRGDIWFWRNGRCPELGPPSAADNAVLGLPPTGVAPTRDDPNRRTATARERETRAPARRQSVDESRRTDELDDGLAFDGRAAWWPTTHKA